MEIFTLLETLEDILENSRSLPFTSKSMVDKEEMLEIIKEIRIKLPDELKQAKWIKEERQRILVEAQKEADGIVKEAENRIISMIDEHEITRKAYEQKAQIIETANEMSREISKGTKDYADAILANLENAINNDGNRMSSLYNLYRLSSTKELLYNTKTNKSKTATLFGGIQYNDIDNKKINDLPGSKFEIEEISKLLNAEGYKIDIYTNNYASEYKFKNVKSQNSILHLSTHGFYNTPNTKHYNLNINFSNESTPAMAFSGLLFSGVSSYLSDKKLIDGEDGILTALEVSQLYFNNLDL